MGWQKRNNGGMPKKHDHVGFMVWAEHEAYCDSCGQHWGISVSYDSMGNEKRKWVPS